MEDHLLFRSLKGQTTAVEEAAVQAWLREAADHERRHRDLATVLAATERTEHRIESTPPSPFKLIHRAESCRVEGSARPRAGRSHWHWRPWLHRSAAAAVVLLVALALADLRLRGIGDFDADEFVTGSTETATVALRDGTVIRLAPQSRLRLIGGKGGREVSLRGRAYFGVARDPSRPFRIETSAGRVEVLGTRFDIQAEGEDMRLLVVEGLVVLSARGGRTEVQAGEMRRIVQGTTLPSVRIPDVVGAIDWTGKFLAFQATPLRDAAREIEQLYAIRIEIPDSAIAAQTLTTWFADQSVEQVMEIVCMVAEARCNWDDSVVTMEGW